MCRKVIPPSWCEEARSSGSRRRARFNLSDLLSQLRQNGISSWSELEDIFLEPTGKVTVLKPSEHLPVAAHQPGISVPRTGIRRILVENGRPLTANLQAPGYTMERLERRTAGPRARHRGRGRRHPAGWMRAPVRQSPIHPHAAGAAAPGMKNGSMLFFRVGCSPGEGRPSGQNWPALPEEPGHARA
ncbi:MAG TPA: hypothetical protein DCM14_07795 [Clostridiales bacterium UBA8153]|nr:hypothetical protein [Clostridiales bacterium UBA8153]